MYKCSIHIAILLSSEGCLLWQREERLHVLFCFFPLHGGRKVRSSCCFGWSCDRPAKVQKRMKAYERTAPQATATSFETFPHSVGLVIKGCNTFPASHTRPLLYRISSARMMLKRTTSRFVARRLCPNVQYLFKKKLVTAPPL